MSTAPVSLATRPPVEQVAAHPRARAWDAPRAATRGGIRVARASMFLLDALGSLRQRYPMPHGPVPHDLPGRAHEVQRIAKTLCALHGVTVSVRGPIPTGPCLVVANHVGYLDPLAIGSVLPCVAIAKHEVARWPVLGEAMRRLGGLFVRRGCAASGAAVLLRARACLVRGVPVLTFPEGTTSSGDAVLPLHRGVFGLARLEQRPVVPVAVRHRPRESAWVGDQTFLPHYLRTATRATTHVDLRFGPPLAPHAAPTAQALAARAREHLTALLHELEDHHA